MGKLLPAQTTFEWPDSRFDVSNYKFIDACLGVRARVKDSVSSRTKDWADSLPRSIFNQKTPLDPLVVAATKKCVSQFTPDKLLPSEYFRAQDLYLSANMDSAAKQVVDRWFNSVSPENLVAVIDSTMGVYLTAYPIRVESALQIYERSEAMASTIPLINRVAQLMFLVAQARRSVDSVLEVRPFQKMISLARSMTDEEWISIPGQQIATGIQLGLQSQYRDHFRDSLLLGTDKYAAVGNTLFRQLVGRDPPDGAFGSMVTQKVGKPSAPVYGDYWFPAQEAGVTYPRLGVVTLIMPINSSDDLRVLESGASVRRLKAKWPELEIVLVTSTRGFFKELEPPPPEKEAAYIDSVFRQFRQLPGVLAVSKTEFWRLPGFDRRRINEPSNNQLEGRGSVDGREQMNVDLIDKEGRIVLNTYPNAGFGEYMLERLIQALISRPYQNTQGAPK